MTESSGDHPETTTTSHGHDFLLHIDIFAIIVYWICQEPDALQAFNMLRALESSRQELRARFRPLGYLHSPYIKARKSAMIQEPERLAGVESWSIYPDGYDIFDFALDRRIDPTHPATKNLLRRWRKIAPSLTLDSTYVGVTFGVSRKDAALVPRLLEAIRSCDYPDNAPFRNTRTPSRIQAVTKPRRQGLAIWTPLQKRKPEC